MHINFCIKMLNKNWQLHIKMLRLQFHLKETFSYINCILFSAAYM